MSLNKIDLGTELLADLYTHVLVESGENPLPQPRQVSPAQPAPASQPALKYLGKNGKHIVLVVDRDNVPFLEDGALSFLTSILSACKLSMGDVALVNVQPLGGKALPDMLETLGARKVILFGVPPLSIDLPMNFPPFQLVDYSQRTYLYSPSLEELENDKGQKGKLWNCLKTLFGI